jgi:hypothetical protein
LNDKILTKVCQLVDDASQLADIIFADMEILVSGRLCGKVRCADGVFQLPLRDFEDCPFSTAWQQLGAVVAFAKLQRLLLRDTLKSARRKSRVLGWPREL